MRRSTSSLIAGSTLIGLGVLALFITLSGSALWTATWRWWPTAFIALGALIAPVDADAWHALKRAEAGAAQADASRAP